MDNPYSKIHQYCKDQKQKAMIRYDRSEGRDKYNANIAINAWDELLGQLYKPNPITPKKFEEVKEMGLRLVGLMADSPYKDHTTKRIQSLKL